MRVRKKRKEYFSIEALRAISFIAISLFHRYTHIFPGGYLAVIIFLLLGGFLFQRNASLSSNSNKSLKAFTKKYVNLLNPVFFIMAISLTISLFFAREIFDDSIRAVIPVGLNVENIARIIRGENYFNQLGNFNILTHMWYVSLYMQLIAIFIILNKLLSKWNDNLKLLVYGLIIILSFIQIYRLAQDPSDITRIYYGIDTRISAFSLGAFTFLIYDKFESFEIDSRINKILVFTLGLIVVAPFIMIDGKNIHSYKAFFIIYTLVVALLVFMAVAYEDKEKVSRRRPGLLKNLVTYIGSRSYFLYIWQYVVQVFSMYFLHDANKIITFVLEVFLIFVLAEMTFILFNKNRYKRRYLSISGFVLILLFITSLIIGNQKQAEIDKLQDEINANKQEIEDRNAGFTAANSSVEDPVKKANENQPYTTDGAKRREEELEAEKNEAAEEIPVEEEEAEEEDVEEPIEEAIEEIQEETDTEFVEKPYDDFEFTEREKEYLSTLSISGLGDSVIINADKYIRNFVPNFYLDGEVGRDMVAGPYKLTELKNRIGLGNIVVISLGSNGTAYHSDMQMIMDIADGRDVYFVNTYHAQSYMDAVNSSIAEFVDTHEKAHLVDWYSYIKDKPDYLAPDRAHPNVPGSDGFAKLIMRKILNVNKVEP